MKLPFFSQSARVLNVSIASIDPNPAQPRRLFEPQAIRELADSIAQNGLLVPISLRKMPNSRYQLIAGERRLMAFRLLGEQSIPALIEQIDDQRAARLALIENMQRQDLTFVEEALAIAALIESEGLTQRQAAEKLGLAQPTLANKLRLLKLPGELLSKLPEYGLTERHARALLPLCGDDRLEGVVKKVHQKQLTVAQTERLVEQTLSERQSRGTRLFILKDLRIFTTTIQRAVDVMKQAGIEARATKVEDDETITYTIVVPKTPGQRPVLSRPDERAV